MSYVTEEYLDKLHKLLNDGGITITRDQLPKVEDIEEGFERDFDSNLFYAIREDNEERTMELFDDILEDGYYGDLIELMLEMADGNFKSFDVTSDRNKDIETVIVNTGDRRYERSFSHAKYYLEEVKLIKYVAAITSERSKNMILKVLDEDFTFLMSLPAEAATFINNKFQVIEVCP